jgi:hypothetical protein
MSNKTIYTSKPTIIPSYGIDMDAKIREREISELPIVLDLKNNGYDIYDIWDLVAYSGSKRDVFAILFHHLKSGKYGDMTKSRLAYIIDSKEAFIYLNELLELYKNESPVSHFKQGLASSISNILKDSKHPQAFQIIHDILIDDMHGNTRLFFLETLKKINSPESIAFLLQLWKIPLYKNNMKSWKSFLRKYGVENES